MEHEGADARTILLVEDDAPAREALTAILKHAGYAVTEAANGREALDRLQTAASPPDLIVLDLMMPVMDGWQFHRALTRDPAFAAFPVVICTGAEDGQMQADVLGAAGCIDKPVDTSKLFSLLRQLLGEGG